MGLEGGQAVPPVPGHVLIAQHPPPLSAVRLPGQLGHADQLLRAAVAHRLGQPRPQPDGKGVPVEALRRRFQQSVGKPPSQVLVRPLQPHHQLVPIQPQGRRPAELRLLQLPAALSDQPAQLLQDHVAKDDAVLLGGLPQPLQAQAGHDPLRPGPPALQQGLEPRAVDVQAGDAVYGGLAQLLGLPLLLLLDVPDAAHQFPALPVGVVHRLGRQRHPGELLVLLPSQPEFRIEIVGVALQGFDGLGPVLLVDVAGVDEAAAEIAAGPFPVHGLVVDQVQHMAVEVVGEEHILGGLQRHLIALLLLQQDVLRLLLPPGQIVHHIVQRVDLQDVGGLEVLQSRAAPADALHQLLGRPGQVPDHHIDAQHPEAQADQHRRHDPDIELAAHAEQILFRVQPQQHPPRVVIGHVVAVQLEGARHRKDALAAHLHVLRHPQVLVPCLPQEKSVLPGQDQVIEHPLAHQGLVRAIRPLDGQHVPRLLGLVQLRHREVVVQGPAGDLHPQHAVGPPPVPQGDGVGDHLIAVLALLLQEKGLGPVAQIHGVRVRVAVPRPPGLVEPAVGLVPPGGIHVEPGGPIGVQRDVPPPGQPFVPPLQQQVRVVGGVGVGVGVTDEKAIELPGLQARPARQRQKGAGGGAALQDLQALGEQRPQQPGPQLGRAQHLVHPHALAAQIVLQHRIHPGGLLVDGGPALVHVVLQDHAAVLHQAAHHAAGVLLQRLGGPPDHQGADGDGALHQHDGDEREEEKAEYGRLFPRFARCPHVLTCSPPRPARRRSPDTTP